MADTIKVYGLSQADDPDNNPDFVTTYITPQPISRHSYIFMGFLRIRMALISVG